MTKLNILPDNPEEGVKGRFPSFLHHRFADKQELFATDHIVKKYGVNTVCQEAKCPNRLECFSKKTATFLVLGKECTRNCGFCDIDFSKTPKMPQEDEPERIASSVLELGLRHVVITMVARDDLQDGGALHLIKIIRAIKQRASKATLELLTSDFQGNWEALGSVLDEGFAIFNHNIETVRRLSPRVRHKATYERSLEVLCFAAKRQKTEYVKSGIMVGLGEEEEEVFATIKDLYLAGCSIITIGHYLQASHKKLPVKAFISPEQFARYEAFGKELGVLKMYCGPFIRSSYNADEILNSINTKNVEINSG